MRKSFDRQYFDKWYRSAAHRVRTKPALARQVTLAVSVAEYLLERPVRRVLDVGCGEGEWSVPLHALRPNATYVGIEPSAYAVARFGSRRSIRPGTVGGLGDVDDLDRFDLVVCSDVLHYVDREEVVRGAQALGARLTGVAYLHAFTSGDDIEGDVRTLKRRPANWYRDTFRRAGLTPVGVGCWVGREMDDALSHLERAE